MAATRIVESARMPIGPADRHAERMAKLLRRAFPDPTAPLVEPLVALAIFAAIEAVLTLAK